jgi:hypothetical protein
MSLVAKSFGTSGDKGASSSGGGVLANFSKRWGGAYRRGTSRQFATSAIVLVMAQKAGGDSTHPIGNVKGIAIRRGFFAGTRREHDCKFWGRISPKPNSIETVADINLVHVDRTVFWVGVLYAKQQPIQSTAKLHCFVRCQLQCVNIHTIV